MNETAYSIYDHLKSHDIVSLLKPLLDSGAYKLRLEDGKIKIKDSQMAYEAPWIYVKHAQGFNCGLWHQVIFNIVSLKLPVNERFVPRHCQDCWKVVVRPKTLQQLFSLLELEKRLERPSKCGIELRESVYGLYGGYFYNKGKERGLECWQAVYDAMSQNEILAPLLDQKDIDGRTTNLILKRSCTEFEHNVGPSDQWKITDEQNFIEDLIEKHLVVDEMNLHQPEHLTWNIKKRWIEWAWQNGDSTYSLYTGGKPLYPAYKTYHQQIQQGSENPEKEI